MQSQPNDVFIVAARRSPIGRLSGCFAGLTAHQLGAQVILKVLADCAKSLEANGDSPKVKEYIIDRLEEVIVGQVYTASTGQNPARQAAVLAGIPYSVSAWGLNMLCGSGLKTVCLAYDRLRYSSASDGGGWLLAGGQESASQSPHACPAGAALRPGGAANSDGLPQLGDFRLIDTVLHDGLKDAYCGWLMGHTAERVAESCAVTREQQDLFALQSQQKYAAAHQAKLFDTELVPIEIPSARKGEHAVVIDQDEHPRPTASLESLSRLKPAFADTEGRGTVTAGNASGINDGAAFLMLCRGDQLSGDCGSVHPLARIVGWHQVGLEPQLMGLGPVGAIQGLLKKLDWTIEMVDVFEVNEAFAAQSVAVANKLNIPAEKMNQMGGAIALGHPLGCSGARVLVTLVHNMRRQLLDNPNRTTLLRGVAALCIGGGMGIAMAMDPSMYADAIGQLNQLFAEAEDISPGVCLENTLGCLTAYLAFLCIRTHYEKTLKKVSEAVGELNSKVFVPRNLFMVDPSERGLRVIELRILPPQ